MAGPSGTAAGATRPDAVIQGGKIAGDGGGAARLVPGVSAGPAAVVEIVFVVGDLFAAHPVDGHSGPHPGRGLGVVDGVDPRGGDDRSEQAAVGDERADSRRGGAVLHEGVVDGYLGGECLGFGRRYEEQPETISRHQTGGDERRAWHHIRQRCRLVVH